MREAVPEHDGGQDAARAVVQPDVLLEVPLRGEALSCGGENMEMQERGTATHHGLVLSHHQEHHLLQDRRDVPCRLSDTGELHRMLPCILGMQTFLLPESRSQLSHRKS